MRKGSICLMYAATPCHAGSGASLGVVDLPIQRERHTEWPMVAASGVKGAMRAHVEAVAGQKEDNSQNFVDKVFGTADAKSAGAISVSDLKILAFPMRSNQYSFVWITCPGVLKRLARDLSLAQNISEPQPIPDHTNDETALVFSTINLTTPLLLEDYKISTLKTEESKPWFRDYFLPQDIPLVLVSDSVFKYGVSCTSVAAQIQIDSETGTAVGGALRYQEELPADSLMYTVVLWGKSLQDPQMSADVIEKTLKEDYLRDFIQIGGDETCGRGFFKIDWK